MNITPARKQVRLSSLTYNAFLSCGGNKPEQELSGIVSESPSGGKWATLEGTG